MKITLQQRQEKEAEMLFKEAQEIDDKMKVLEKAFDSKLTALKELRANPEKYFQNIDKD